MSVITFTFTVYGANHSEIYASACRVASEYLDLGLPLRQIDLDKRCRVFNIESRPFARTHDKVATMWEADVAVEWHG